VVPGNSFFSNLATAFHATAGRPASQRAATIASSVKDHSPFRTQARNVTSQSPLRHRTFTTPNHSCPYSEPVGGSQATRRQYAAHPSIGSVLARVPAHGGSRTYRRDSHRRSRNGRCGQPVFRGLDGEVVSKDLHRQGTRIREAGGQSIPTPRPSPATSEGDAGRIAAHRGCGGQS